MGEDHRGGTMRKLALVALFVAACGDDGGGPIPIDGLESAAIGAYCNLYVRCGLIDDAATCRTLNLDVQIDPDLIAAVDAGKVIYHPDLARECLNGLSGSCNRATFSRNDNGEACELA